jgi:Protein of unknown function (DUF1488)
MAELAFLDEFRLFDGNCVRFYGHDGDRKVLCGVTVEALKRCDPRLPRNGLVPAEEFLNAFERLMVDIHDTARAKHAKGELERDGDIKVLIKRHDLLAY